MLVGEDFKFSLQSTHYLSDEELFCRVVRQQPSKKAGSSIAQLTRFFDQPHNTINRLTGATGKGRFAPFSETSMFYHPDVILTIFAMLDLQATDIERVCVALQRIGSWGFGKDASTGCGRFQLVEHKEIPLPALESANACYVLAPTVPQKQSFSRLYFTPFVRFGKHGDVLVRSGNPFKNPVIMADEGAVFVPKDRNVLTRPYIGRAVGNISKSMPQSICQGYSIYLPFTMET